MHADPDDTQRRLDEAVYAISGRMAGPPSVGLILGSGLGEFLNDLAGNTSVSYADIPNFPRSTVVGHAGNLIFNRIGTMTFAALQGRVHYYEGYSIREVVFPVRVLARLGVGKLIITNAAGGINRTFQPGDLMLIADHINLMGANPLTGQNLEALGPRFPDMSEAYSRKFRELARAVAEEKRIGLQEGVYVGLAGPSYETPAEIRMLAALGADAVGMSTVPEVIAGRHAGIAVLGVSCITNMAAGILDRKLDHAEVMETTVRVKDKFAGLVRGLLDRLAAGAEV
ncbi:MAG: purine-nucleoside phosphorylase [Acidobacteria bacterium]|nr:purine-nucleoside phosphorylase [Acidobacteriota bacterium]